MGMRITENRSDTPLNIKIPLNLKIEVDKAADAENISTAKWVRKVLEEKINSMRSGNTAAVPDSARSAGSALTEERIRDMIMRCLDDCGVPYKKTAAAADNKEQSAAGPDYQSADNS